MAPHFLTLPIELRLKAYRFVIVDKLVVDVPARTLERRGPSVPNHPLHYQIGGQIGKVRWSLILLLVNKQTKAEVEPLLLKKIWAHFQGTDTWPDGRLGSRKNILPMVVARNFFEDIFFISNSTIWKVTRLSLPIGVVRPMLRCCPGTGYNFRSRLELVFYDDGKHGQLGTDRFVQVLLNKRTTREETTKGVVMKQADTLVQEFLPRLLAYKLGAEVRFEIFLNNAEVRVLLCGLLPV